MQKAFNYMFKDNKFWVKLLHFYGLMLLAILSLLLTIRISPKFMLLALAPGLVCAITLTGYAFNVTKALTLQHENYVLPYINFKHAFVTGITYILAAILFAVLTGLVAGFPLILALTPLKTLGEILCVITAHIVGIFEIVYWVGLHWLFANTEDITALVKIKEIIALVKLNTKNYFKYWTINLGFGIICSIICKILTAEKVLGKFSIISYIIFFLIIPFVVFISAFITAKSLSAECTNKI